MIVVASLGFVLLAAVWAAEHGLVGLGELLATPLLVVLVAHQAGEVGHATLRRWGEGEGSRGLGLHVATLKRLGCRFSTEEHSRGAHSEEKLCQTIPIEVLGNLTVPRQPGTSMTDSALEGWEELSLPHPNTQTELSGQTHSRQREGKALGRGCLHGEQSTRGTNLCHTPPLPVRDLSATHLALVLVWFGLV